MKLLNKVYLTGIVWLCTICLAQANTYPINSPYQLAEAQQNTLYSSYNEQPKHFDPARSYSEDEQVFIAQIYEPIYQYHYLIRPYKLDPLSGDGYIHTEYYDSNNKKLAESAVSSQISYTIYTIKIKPNIYYQPHPALAKSIKNNRFVYHDLSEQFINNVQSISDFKLNAPNITCTRELLAQDFIYEIKRLADPKVQSPIYGLMSNYIYNFTDLNKILVEDNKADKFINLNDPKYDIDGLRLIDKYTYQIKIKGKYPQFAYWLAMPFFAPMPWEADKFYSQPGLAKQNISIDTYPIGTGPYMMTVNIPNQKIVLEKNPNYNLVYNHGIYPTQGMPEDKANGLLTRAGQKLPFIDKVVFHLEKESIPVWNKFLQGYYDSAGISSDNFNQAVSFANNNYELSKEMQDRKIKLIRSVEPSVFYWGFNMLDPKVGGYDVSHIKLRQAISIAIDIKEYINIFRNGRGKIAYDPIPPIIMSDSEKALNYNPVSYQGKDVKKSLDQAKKLLAEAGYPNGIDKKTGHQLVLRYDAIMTASSDESALFNWLREQFQKINIKLDIEATQYNRFQEKLRRGSVQMFFLGWNADYPDPENFLFLFLCEQSRAEHNGENASNYCNRNFDKLFAQMQDATDIRERNKIINQMIKILQADSPWIFGLFNESFVLQHDWNDPIKSLTIGNNNLKYKSIDTKKRLQQQTALNQPIYWPIIAFILLLIGLILPVAIAYYKKMHHPVERI